MISEMIAALSNHLWQSTLFVLAAGVLALVLFRTARTRELDTAEVLRSGH